jgi:hypothetical protein
MPKHVVVDGSNLATEGRSLPSLKQLSEAVESYMAENPTHVITVVVDATFGHRIDPSEIPEFDAAVENNEIVSPPAGAIGRGDAFVLTIANKANAIILSNDSFQEFHPDYPWLFDEGRLVGGKPVPHVGWVFVARSPVRGIVSRRATKAKKAKERGPAKVATPKPSALALEPMPVPKIPPPRKAASNAKAASAEAPVKPAKQDTAKDTGRGASRQTARPEPAKPKHGEAAKAAPNAPMVNELGPFLSFVEHHPVGSVVEAKVDSYSSHGAYASCADGVRLYIPMRAMATPAPRSAREVLSLGQTLPFVVVSFNAARRGIDAGVPGVVTVEAPAPAKRGSGAKKAAPTKPTPEKTEPPEKAAPKKAAPNKAAPKKVAAKKAAAKKVSAENAVAKNAPTEKVVTEKAPPKKAAAKKAATNKTVAKPAPAKNATAGKAPAKKAAAKKAAAKVLEAPAAVAPIESVSASQKPTKKASAKKASAKKARAEKPPAKKVPVNTSGASKAPRSSETKTATKAAAKKAVADKKPAPAKTVEPAGKAVAKAVFSKAAKQGRTR